jgi:hypothetical protein
VSGLLRRRLGNLEASYGHTKERAADADERLKAVRRQAEHSNRCHEGRGEPTRFEVTEAGDVLCAHDGKPVTNTHQTLAEDFYWMTVEFGGDPNLVHDEEAQAFYTQGGELALSRDHVHLSRLMGGGGA